MWFDIVKINLAELNTKLQGDVEGKNINIEPDDKCRKKLINFQNKMLALGKREKAIYMMSHEKLEKEVPESVACKFVEVLDKYFNNIKAAEFSNGKFVGPDYDDDGKIDENYGYSVWYRIHNSTNIRLDRGEESVISVVLVLMHPEHTYHMAFLMTDAQPTHEFKRLWEGL